MLEVNATRMELLKLKKRLVLARKGYDFLKKKQDELMRRFFELLEQVGELRTDIENRIQKAHRSFLMALSVMDREKLEEAMMFPSQKLNMEVSTASVMNLRLPRFDVSSEGSVYSYGFAETSADLDSALGAYSELLPEMLRLSQIERSVELLANEIEVTRRRVNALEYILIPNLQDTIKYITMRLDEMERSNLSRLMRVKEIVRSH
ncbi:TPA: V-type ATP synthase subunit D [Candidatus Poribacteria bacterium]|nr:V-type ATP synthase subunit D [Candidatus Poribacteria bacterium]